MYSHVYAALMAIINTKFGNGGITVDIVYCTIFKRTYYHRSEKSYCLGSVTFIAHILINQSVAHEILVLAFLTLFVGTTTEDLIGVAVAILKEFGKKRAKSVKINAICYAIYYMMNPIKLFKGKYIL